MRDDMLMPLSYYCYEDEHNRWNVPKIYATNYRSSLKAPAVPLDFSLRWADYSAIFIPVVISSAEE
jgi:hypothetical protein